LVRGVRAEKRYSVLEEKQRRLARPGVRVTFLFQGEALNDPRMPAHVLHGAATQRGTVPGLRRPMQRHTDQDYEHGVSSSETGSRAPQSFC
jgi:hypothetical protein